MEHNLTSGDIRLLLIYIIDQIVEHGGNPIKTQLVKLLYLIDIEYYRAKKKTLTGLPWIFYHYGPYAFELEPVIATLNVSDITETPFITKKSKPGVAYHGITQSDEAERDFDRVFTPWKKIIVNRVIDRWALEDLWELLDYIYFETEPMKHAKRGITLDFNEVEEEQSSRRYSETTLDPETLAKLRANLTKRRTQKERGKQPSPAPYDEIYEKSLEIMNSEDNQVQSSGGDVEVRWQE
jgi:hypothetical protein